MEGEIFIMQTREICPAFAIRGDQNIWWFCVCLLYDTLVKGSSPHFVVVVQKRSYEPSLIPNFPKSHRYWQLSSENMSLFGRLRSHGTVCLRHALWVAIPFVLRPVLCVHPGNPPMNHKSKRRNHLISAGDFLRGEEYPYFTYNVCIDIVHGSHERWQHRSLRPVVCRKEKTRCVNDFLFWKTKNRNGENDRLISWWVKVSRVPSTGTYHFRKGICEQIVYFPFFSTTATGSPK